MKNNNGIALRCKTVVMATPSIALTIAGLDPTGGAGLSADLRTFDAFGVHGAVIATTLTVQDTSRFASATPSDPGLVERQLEMLLPDLDVAATKIGMVPNAELLGLIGSMASRLPNLVVDPVAVDRHGTALVGAEELRVFREQLLPACAVLTPNRAELAWLLGEDVVPESDVDAIVAQAVSLRERGTEWVVVTGGRVGLDDAVDIVLGPEVELVWREKRIDTRNDRGSGCTFSAAITASLARGDSMLEAITEAHAFVQRALRAAVGWQIGSGTGPIAQNHHQIP